MYYFDEFVILDFILYLILDSIISYNSPIFLRYSFIAIAAFSYFPKPICYFFTSFLTISPMILDGSKF